jgi:RNA polymerase sigma-70 factor (TIGR02943 family)
MNTEREILNPQKWLLLYGDYLFSLAMYRVGHKETSEDLVQETFVSAMRMKETFRGDSSEKTWLVSILKNKIIDYYRKKDVLKDTTSYLKETEDSFSEHFFEKGNGHWLGTAAPQEWTTYADSALTENEFYQVLHGCIQKMPPSLISIFTMKFIDDEDSETICKVSNISSSNYWVIIHRAKVLVRSCLEKKWFLK